MRREIVINQAGHETRIAIVEDGRLVELMHERPDTRRTVGDIYLGRVEAVVPGLQAAFVDIGSEKAGFLHASDVGEPLEEDEEEEEANGNGDRRSRRYPPIQEAISRGQEILVQVTKEAIGTKGPRLTSQVSLPGRFLVYMPFSSHIGISRKIEDREERARLRKLAQEALDGDSGGLIVRTVGEELGRDTLTRELERLRSTWEKVSRRARSSKAPARVHEEAELTSGLIRDVFSERIDRLTVDSTELSHQIKSYLGQVSPDLVDRVEVYTGREQIFDHFGIEEQIRNAFRRKVDLPSGGHIVIEATEALVAVDVNTGRYTGRKDPAETILRTNLDAAAEVCRQLRLRDIGGIIVVDFIDMDDLQARERVVQEMKSHLGRDRARTRVFGISELGLLQMSRQRVRPSLVQAMTEPCPFCDGTGRVLSPETVVRRLERAIRRAAASGEEGDLDLVVHPRVALYLLEEEHDFLKEIGEESGLRLEVRDDPLLGLDETRLLAGPSDVDVTEKYGVGV